MRDKRIDLLRFIGLSMIILAHVEPPDLIMQIRNFDVPIMVIISGISFSISFKNKETFSLYVWKRFKRLVLPVWAFLSIFFLLMTHLFPHTIDLNLKIMAKSYLLTDGIGYVWIIRVFLLVALVSPLLYHWNQKEKSNTRYLLTLAALAIAYEIFRYYSMPYIHGGKLRLISLVSHYVLAYSLIFALGLRIYQFKKPELIATFLVAIATFVITRWYLGSYTDSSISTQDYKYPPSFYYFSYSIFVFAILWSISDKIVSFVESIKLSGVVFFVAQNSIWVYLWHILFITLLPDNYYLEKYLLTYISAGIITYFQTRIVNLIINKESLPNGMKKNIRMVFTG